MRARMPHKLVDAIVQGLTAHREYERLMSMGVRHDPALRAALCIPVVPTGGPIANSRARSAGRATPLMRPASLKNLDGLKEMAS
jgi:hypothetical protein